MSSFVSIVLPYYLDHGGIINMIIFFCAVFALYCGLERYEFYCSLWKKMHREELSNEERFIQVYTLSHGLNTMLVWTTATPLLGLLGTVIGMIETFDTITRYGNSNPVFLTEGIAVALHTTQAGLLVSIPLLLFFSVIVQKRNRIFHLLKTGEEE